MPNIQVKLRRGTDAEHAGFTGAEGEVTVDTTNDTLRVHDGSTAGGVRLAKLSEAGGSGTVTSVDSGTGLTGGPVTTSGTLSIDTGGVDTTQLADDGVTFAKMQNISTAKVIGRTTAGSGDPEEVSILDEDAMTSNSDTALATQQSIKAYVDSQVGVSKFTSTEQTLTATSTITASHGLGGVPDLATGHLVCKTAEYGYAVGDELEVGMSWFSDGSPGTSQENGIAVVKNSSNVLALIGESVEVPNRTNLGQAAAITLGSWKLVLTALTF